MKKLFLSLLLLCAMFINAQNNKYSNIIESIKSDTSYYYGESAIMSLQESAYQESIESLYSNIAENYAGKSYILYFGSDDPKEYLKKIIATFENDIENVLFQYPILEEEDGYSYFSYLKKSDFRKICNDRVGEIQRYANIGLKYENKSVKLDYALRSYYWGMTLCVAHPQGSVVKINVDKQSYDAYSWFEQRINNILSSFNFSINENMPGEINNNIRYINLNVSASSTDTPISNLKIRYFNGRRNVTELVNDGMALIKLHDENMTKFDVRIEYDFEDNAMPELKNILRSIDKVTFKSNIRREIDFGVHIDNFTKQENNESYDVEDKDYGDDYLSIIKEVEKGFRSKQYSNIKRFFSSEGYNMLDTLVSFSDITVVGQQHYEFIDCKDIVVCRGINVKFDFKNSPGYLDELVFRFDKKSNLITSIAFKLSSETEDDIHSKTRWPLESRLTLVNFIEDYQTAYALKRYEYLESIFSDDALIIVGHVVKKVEEPLPDKMNLNLSSNEITLIETDKKTYFKNLSRVFDAQEYIYIRFAETDFSRQMSTEDESYGAKKYEDIYGVRLLQEYNSTTYSDVGYLFLLVDLRKEVPIIHVRAWQPDKVEINDLIGLKNLR